MTNHGLLRSAAILLITILTVAGTAGLPALVNRRVIQ